MKKALSILMAILVLSTALVFCVGAAQAACGCRDHTDAAAGCHCCIDCDNLDTHYLTSCVKGPDGKLDTSSICCIECTGIYPCACGCDCCTLSDDDINDSGFDPILNEEQQETVIETFQRVLGQIREFFDNFFNTIFEFLRFDDIMGA